MLPQHFLTDDCPLHGEDAVAAIITVEDGRYLMQLRDDIPRIFYPGHWGCFGGAVNPGEDDVGAMRRELAEELEMQVSAVKEFIRFNFDLRKLGQKQCYRIYYEFKVAAAEVSRFVLHEGAEMNSFRQQNCSTFVWHPMILSRSGCIFPAVALHRREICDEV